MLSPHEFATLLLVDSDLDPTDLNREDLAALVERQLVALERRASGHAQPKLTADGQLLLKAVTTTRH